MPSYDCLTTILTNDKTSDNQCAQQRVIHTIQGGSVIELTWYAINVGKEETLLWSSLIMMQRFKF